MRLGAARRGRRERVDHHVAGAVVEGERGVARRRRRRATLAMPPMFCSARTRPGARNSSQSAKGTSGAPSPPSATSATRKSPTVTAPVRAAITAGSPSCSVDGDAARGACDGGWCQTVWPWLPTRSTSRGAALPRRSTASAASANQLAEEEVALAERARVAGEQRVDGLRAALGVYGVVRKSTSATRASRAEAVDLDQRGVDAVDRGARHEAHHALLRLLEERDERVRRDGRRCCDARE